VKRRRMFLQRRKLELADLYWADPSAIFLVEGARQSRSKDITQAGCRRAANARRAGIRLWRRGAVYELWG
jgi:hypothetical protein